MCSRLLSLLLRLTSKSTPLEKLLLALSCAFPKQRGVQSAQRQPLRTRSLRRLSRGAVLKGGLSLRRLSRVARVLPALILLPIPSSSHLPLRQSAYPPHPSRQRTTSPRFSPRMPPLLLPLQPRARRALLPSTLQWLPTIPPPFSSSRPSFSLSGGPIVPSTRSYSTTRPKQLDPLPPQLPPLPLVPEPPFSPDLLLLLPPCRPLSLGLPQSLLLDLALLLRIVLPRSPSLPPTVLLSSGAPPRLSSLPSSPPPPIARLLRTLCLLPVPSPFPLSPQPSFLPPRHIRRHPPPPCLP